MKGECSNWSIRDVLRLGAGAAYVFSDAELLCAADAISYGVSLGEIVCFADVHRPVCVSGARTVQLIRAVMERVVFVGQITMRTEVHTGPFFSSSATFPAWDGLPPSTRWAIGGHGYPLRIVLDSVATLQWQRLHGRAAETDRLADLWHGYHLPVRYTLAPGNYRMMEVLDDARFPDFRNRY